jgi:RecJ-like exonuclease
MKCPMCGGDGITDKFTPNVGRCIKCHGTGEIEVTNEEWLEQASTEEKAKFILDIKEHCYYCGAKQIPDRERCPFRDGKCRNNLHEFLGWLKEKHHVESGM